MAGRFDLAGVGPGDPELMTIKTIRAIKACQVLVLPIGSPELKKPELEEGEEETFAKECLAYRIACEAEPETKKKLRLYLPMPMIKEKKLLKEIHDAGARKASELLEKGKNLVFLTIGDPTVYSTGIYIYKRLKKMGYQGEIFSGIPSFCAAAARLEISLVENRHELHVLPVSYGIEEKLKLPGTKVLMKTGKKMAQVKAVLKEEGQQAKMVMNCGMDGEKIYTESVEKEKLLFAREDKYVNNEVEGEKVAEGILINSECLHWKYMFDLKEVINESGEYCVSITVHQDGKSAILINSLSVQNKEYIFAKDSMEKDY